MIGSLVQSKLGVVTGVMAMWFNGLNKGSRSVRSSRILSFVSDADGVDVLAVDPSMLGTDAPGIGSEPDDTEGRRF